MGYKRIRNAAALLSVLVCSALLFGETAPAADPVQTPAEGEGADAKAKAAPPKSKPGGQITPATWSEQAGFKPDLTGLGDISGKEISASNAGQYEKYLSKGLSVLINKYKLDMKMKGYKAIRPSLGYIEATNKYAGQPKIIDIGKDYRKRGLENYTAGLPFPQPKNGLEVAWNYNYAYNGDDGDLHYAVQWVSAARGVEHTEEWRWAFIIRTINRTDIEPIPAIPEFLEQEIQYTSLTYALSPYDKKGFGAVYSRKVTPQDQQGHIYVPAMKRVLRNTFGTRGDTWNSTDLLYEDVRGYMGYPEWMNWKLVGKFTKFGPMNAGIRLGKKNIENTFKNDTWPHWNPKANWEPRPTYVLEVTSKMPDYPYSKQIMFVDAETYFIYYKEVYDRKGELWKVLINGFNKSPNADTVPPMYAMSLVVDLQSEHATTFPVYSYDANTKLNPGMFTLSSLRKRGR
ncbi:MAG: DUF1329 domain-containing protein [Myxococcota bacterium]|jgi:hypothetical protein|nr:DUF1329 domain-containing protein [Myxococcota bacterium]